MSLSGNVGSAYGGCILNEGVLTVFNSTFSNNSASKGGSGGAILNFGVLTVTDSTFSGNYADTEGGAIFSNNDIFVDQPGLFVTNSTFEGNSSAQGGGIYNDVGTPLSIKNTLLAGNSGGNCTLNGPTTSQGHNLSDDATCASGFTMATDQNGVAAGLDPKGLQDNGGPTQTVALLPTSLARDAIPVASCTDTSGKPVQTDQRGITRPQGSGCDIGAFELVENTSFSAFHAQLVLAAGKYPGFNLTGEFTLAAGEKLTPLTEVVTLTIGSYNLTLPARSFHEIQIGPFVSYSYIGTANRVNITVQIVPLGGSHYGLEAVGVPVVMSGSTTSVPITLIIGQDAGTTSVIPFRLP